MVVLEPIRVGSDDLKGLQPLLIVVPVYDLIQLKLVNSRASPIPCELIL